MAKKSPINPSDLQGITQMISDATIGITDLVEAMQNRIVHPPFLPSTPAQKLITGTSSLIFKSIRLSTKIIGGGLDKALEKLQPLFEESQPSEGKETILAILNGVIGDYLEENQNSLAIPMQFKYKNQPLSFSLENNNNVLSKNNGKLLLMVHGSSMNHLHWKQEEFDLGIALANELDLTPIYLHYNSGRHISTNGKELNLLLENLVKNWNQPLESIYIVAHSMGGLVSRSAIHYGTQEKQTWAKYLQKVVFLGTPHHGAPLEKMGNYLDLILEKTPYVKPFARLGKIRSAGVTDLRYGNLVDEDWEGLDRFEMNGDTRNHVPLPAGIDCYNIAATKSNENKDWKSNLIGDGLVPVTSALGKHKNEAKDLKFPTANNWILKESNHTDLLRKVEVLEQIKIWFLKD